MEFLQVDVFADSTYCGNPLAVFPEAGTLEAPQMQAIAREMNLSETSFVTSVGDDSYDVRIFTPEEELPFAGHPTLGTAWVLRRLGRLTGDRINQRSPAGSTTVTVMDDLLWLERDGDTEADLEDLDIRSPERLERAFGLQSGEIGLEATELGMNGRLRPAFADAGMRALLIPVRSIEVLERCRPRWHLLDEISTVGGYCFTAAGSGRARSRGFFPGLGIPEDPATGAGAAALGVYLADRLGKIEIEMMQGVEMGRPSHIYLKADEGRVQVGGRVTLIFTGRLERLP